MKIRHVGVNNRKAQLELGVRSGKVLPVPYAKLDPRPTPKNRIREALPSVHDVLVHVEPAGRVRGAATSDTN